MSRPEGLDSSLQAQADYFSARLLAFPDPLLIADLHRNPAKLSRFAARHPPLYAVLASLKLIEDGAFRRSAYNRSQQASTKSMFIQILSISSPPKDLLRTFP
jgi:hypothetical protein